MSPSHSDAVTQRPVNNPWIPATTALAGIIVGFVLAGGTQSLGMPVANIPTQQPTVAAGDTAVPTPPAPSGDPANADDDPMLGDEDATVTLIEFTDYQCPFCSRHFEQTYGQIKKDYVDTGKVKLVVRDYPLSFHPNAQKASEATECADDQGKFWEMHDKLFQTQGTWSNGDGATAFKQMAKDLGLNSATFDACLDGGTHAQEVADDMAAGSASGISGTPGFWIVGPDGKGQLISGAYPYDTFKAAFDALL